MDMFDCVIPTREGRHGRLFIWKKQTEFEINEQNSKQNSNSQEITDDLGSNFYETLNLANEKFKEDFTPLENDCQCETCQQFTRAYLHHLLKTNEPLFLKLASVHNLHFYLSLMKKMGK